MFGEISREYKLKKGLKKLKAIYDYTVIDCPSNASLLTVNALAASDYVIIPIKAEYFSISGVEPMIEFCQMIKDNLNDELDILGLLITQYDERLTIAKEIIQVIKNNNWESALFDTKIRKNIAVAAAQFKQKTIFEHDAKSNAAADYLSFSKEVLKRINN